LALLFALAGIWALVAFTVEARRHEFGIRVALGAAPAHMRMALRQVAALTAAGAVAGLAGAWLLSRFLTAYLFQLSPTDPATYAAATLAFAAVALAAAAIPARRVLDADAAVALRSEQRPKGNGTGRSGAAPRAWSSNLVAPGVVPGRSATRRCQSFFFRA